MPNALLMFLTAEGLMCHFQALLSTRYQDLHRIFILFPLVQTSGLGTQATGSIGCGFLIHCTQWTMLEAESCKRTNYALLCFKVLALDPEKLGSVPACAIKILCDFEQEWAFLNISEEWNM